MKKTIWVLILVFAIMAVFAMAEGNETNTTTDETSHEPLRKVVQKRGDSGIGFAPCKDFNLQMRKGAMYNAYVVNVKPIIRFPFGMSKGYFFGSPVLYYNDDAMLVDGSIADLNKDGTPDAKISLVKDYNGVSIINVKTQCG